MTDYEWLAERVEKVDVRYCNRCGQVGFHEITQVCEVCGYRPEVTPSKEVLALVAAIQGAIDRYVTRARLDDDAESEPYIAVVWVHEAIDSVLHPYEWQDPLNMSGSGA